MNLVGKLWQFGPDGGGVVVEDEPHEVGVLQDVDLDLGHVTRRGRVVGRHVELEVAVSEPSVRLVRLHDARHFVNQEHGVV